MNSSRWPVAARNQVFHVKNPVDTPNSYSVDEKIDNDWQKNRQNGIGNLCAMGDYADAPANAEAALFVILSLRCPRKFTASVRE